MNKLPGKLAFSSATDFRGLFVFAFETATARLGSADLATIQRTAPGQLADLNWMPPENQSAVTAHLERLSRRNAKHRFDIDKVIRAQLRKEIGGPAALEDGRRMFVLAALVDRTFQWPAVGDDQTVDLATSIRHSVMEPPQIFFAGIPNAPPPLGQMTAVAICQRWMTSFWVTGDLRHVRGLGPAPPIEWRKASGRLRLRFEQALSEGRLTVATIGWRVGSKDEIEWHDAEEGCFAVAGFRNPIDAPTVSRVLDHLRKVQADIAILPEMGLDEDGLRLLREGLARERARFPVLVLSGIVHQATGDGGFVNEAVVLDGLGQELFRHTKLEPYTLATGKVEGILPRPPAPYVCFDTPIGRLVVNICRDFRSDIPMILNRLLGASLILIPAWSRNLDFVLEEARVLGARQGAIVVSSNMPIPDNRDVAASYAPVRSKDAGRIVGLSEVPTGGQVIVSVREFQFSADHQGVAEAPTAAVV